MRERQNSKPGSGLNAYSFIGGRFGFAKVAAPVSAFVEDFCKQIPDMEQSEKREKIFALIGFRGRILQQRPRSAAYL
jgi:hypothetical protein